MLEDQYAVRLARVRSFGPFKGLHAVGNAFYLFWTTRCESWSEQPKDEPIGLLLWASREAE
jgi:hypothetical protein